jgi:hypothetical protein
MSMPMSTTATSIATSGMNMASATTAAAAAASSTAMSMGHGMGGDGPHACKISVSFPRSELSAIKNRDIHALYQRNKMLTYGCRCCGIGTLSKWCRRSFRDSTANQYRYTIDSCFLSSSWHVTSNGMFAGACIGVIILVILLEFLRRLGKEYDRNILRAHQRKISLSSTSSPNSSSDAGNSKSGTGIMNRALLPTSTATKFRPSILQQAIRALLHMLAFAVAYFVML